MKKLEKLQQKFKKYSKIFNWWSVFNWLDLDPDPYVINGSGPGSRRAHYTRIRLDPDPQHTKKPKNGCEEI